MKLAKFFRLKNGDFVLACGTLLALVSMAAPVLMSWDADKANTGIQLYPIAMGAFYGGVLGMACIAGSCRRYRRTDVFLAIGFVVLSISLFGWSLTLNGVWDPVDRQNNCRISYTTWLQVFGWQALRRFALVFGVALLTIFSVSNIATWMFGATSRFDRSRFLVTAAVAGGLAVIGNNVIAESQFVSDYVESLTYGGPLGFVLLVISLVFLGVWMPRIPVWAKSLVSLFIIGLGVVSGLWQNAFANLFGSSFTYAMLAFWMVFLLLLVVVSPDPKILVPDDQTEEGSVVARQPEWRASWILGALLVLLLVCAATYNRFVDTPTLLRCMTNRWEAARLVRELTVTHGAELFGQIDGKPGNQVWIRIDEGTSDHVLSAFESSPLQFSKITLEDMKPNIVWSLPVNFGAGEIEFVNGTVSSVQLHAEAERALASMKFAPSLVFNNTQISGENGTLKPVGTWTFVDPRPGEIASFLSLVEDDSMQGYLAVNGGEINSRDWQEIGKMADRIQVFLYYVNWSDELQEYIESSPVSGKGNIIFVDRFRDTEHADAVELLCLLAEKTEMNFRVWWLFEDHVYWNEVHGLETSMLKRLLGVAPKRGLFGDSRRSLKIKDSFIDLELSQQIVGFPVTHTIHLSHCRFSEEVFGQWQNGVRPAKSNVNIEKPMDANGEENIAAGFEFSLKSEASFIWPDKTGAYDFLASILADDLDRVTPAEKHLLICGYQYWTGSYVSPVVLNANAPGGSFRQTWLLRLEELKGSPGLLSQKVFKELERMGFAWENQAGDVFVWIPPEYSAMNDAIEYCTGINTLIMDVDISKDASQSIKESAFEDVESLFLGSSFGLNWESYPIPKNMPALRELWISSRWFETAATTRGCPKLEKLTLFESPTPSQLANLKLLKSLNKLLICDVRYLPAAQGGGGQKVTISLAGVKVEVSKELEDFDTGFEGLTNKQRLRMRQKVTDLLFPPRN
jgi:hypothetical protein